MCGVLVCVCSVQGTCRKIRAAKCLQGESAQSVWVRVGASISVCVFWGMLCRDGDSVGVPMQSCGQLRRSVCVCCRTGL